MAQEFVLISKEEVVLEGVCYLKSVVQGADAYPPNTILQYAGAQMTKRSQHGFIIVPSEGGFTVRQVLKGHCADAVKDTVSELVRPGDNQFVLLAQKTSSEPKVVRNVTKNTTFVKPVEKPAEKQDPGHLDVIIHGAEWTLEFVRDGMEKKVTTGKVEQGSSGQATILAAIVDALSGAKPGPWTTSVFPNDRNVAKMLCGEMKSRKHAELVEKARAELKRHNAQLD